MKGNLTFNTIPIKFCAMVEQYRLELAKKSPIDLQLDVSLPWITICWIHETVLISKKFEFIKWLYENDKIDFRKLDDNLDWYDINTNREYLDLIALISIQDNPIEFLISILK